MKAVNTNDMISIYPLVHIHSLFSVCHMYSITSLLLFIDDLCLKSCIFQDKLVKLIQEIASIEV